MEKTTRRKRRMDSASSGNTFLSRRDLGLRWGCGPATVISRVKQNNIPEFCFNEKSVRYKLADIEAYERSLMGAGFQKRSEQLKRLEAVN